MDKLLIIYIGSDDCKDCIRILNDLNDLTDSITNADSTCEIKKFSYNDPTAINIAIYYGINDLPGLVFNNGKVVLYGPRLTKEALVGALEKCKN